MENDGDVGASGLIGGLYSGPGVILNFFYSNGNLDAPPNLLLTPPDFIILSASFISI